MKHSMLFFWIVVLAFTVSSAFAQDTDKTTDTPKDKKPAKAKEDVVIIETKFGEIEIAFYPKDAPKTVKNFVEHAKKGYYTGLIFHRVINGFMIQGGDPTGTGSGGESIYGAKFEDEIKASSELYKTGYVPGVVAMANAGPNTNGSQFFIMHKKAGLPPSYTIFGRVIKGQEVVDKIATTKTGPGDRPVEEVKMIAVKAVKKVVK